MTKKKFSFQSISLIITLGFVSAALIIYLLTSGLNVIYQNRSLIRVRENSVKLIANQKEIELNSCFNSVESAVDVMKRYVLSSIDEERILKDPDYYQDYMNDVAMEFIEAASFTKNVISLYFKLEANRFGGDSAVFLTGNNRTGFISVKPTDIFQYSPKDMEHVGWYYAAVWNEGPVWTVPYENKNINAFMISYVVPLYKDGGLLGIVGMDVSLASIKDTIDTMPLPEMFGMLVGEERNLIYYSNSYFEKKSFDWASDIKDMEPLFENYQVRETRKMMWNGSLYHAIVRKLENSMFLVVAMPETIATDAKKTLAGELTLIFIIVVVLVLIIRYFVIAHFVKPIKIITDSTFRIARGELNCSIPYKSKNEIGQLADSVRKMEGQLQEYIEYIREQTLHEREAKELAINESRTKSEFLANLYLSLHEIDLSTDTFVEVHAHAHIADAIGKCVNNANDVLYRVMQTLVSEKDPSREQMMEFVNLKTLDERMKNKISITQEFMGHDGAWCRGRFIEIDRNKDGTLHHVFWATENIDEEKRERNLLQYEVERTAAASQAKSVFLANMSHEIRTPINAILGMDEIILRETSDSNIINYATNIKSAGAILLSIVNDILDFSKIESGKMELIFESYDISVLLSEIINMIQPRAQTKDLELILNVDPDLPKILFGDSIRIKQCILNLLTNAVKYTKEGSVVLSVSFKKHYEDMIELCVSVKDTGCGIKKENLSKLFSPFERIDEGKNRTIEGTGLGMTIVQKMLAMMGSRIMVSSEYGKGSEFSFVLQQKVISWDKAGNFYDDYKMKFHTRKTYKEKLHAPDAFILFVDDTVINLEVVKGLLKNTGIKIDTATSGKETLKKIQENKYDILFIDHLMPEMDGIETLHKMKSLKKNLCKDKPCIVLTANAVSGAKKMYLNEGFTDYLSKPVNPEMLEEMIRKYLPAEMLRDDMIDSSESDEVDDEAHEQLLNRLKDVEGIDLDVALENCGTAELVEKTIRTYLSMLDKTYDELQGYFEKEDLENYAIKVHALKSSSRLIGAMELSSKAEHLEFAAKNGEIEEIREKHPAMMELYAAYREKLSAFAVTEENKISISNEEFMKKLSELSEAANSYNLDEVDRVIASLSECSFDQSFNDVFEQLKSHAVNVDFEALIKLLSEFISAHKE